MVNLSTFQQYLATDTPLSQPLPRSFNSDEQHLRKWAALLPLQAEMQQIEKKEKDIYIIDAEEKLSNIFGAKVNISMNNKKGKIEISYNNEDELNDILSMIMEEN